MPSSTPDTDLWLERSRLNGMLLGAISYGILVTLTLQCTDILWNTQRQGREKRSEQRFILLGYVLVTFVLATIGFAGNAKYTQTIWIDRRNAPGGPAALIQLELNDKINVMALACYYVMEWFMDGLLLHRCCTIWGWRWYIVAVMSVLFFGDIVASIIVLERSGQGAVFYSNNIQLAYLSISVSLNIIYTILVVGRLIAMRNQIKHVLGEEHSRTYTSIAAMIVESASMYTVLGILFIAAFAKGSDLSNLIFLSISHVQGIAQLLIIRRVATGRAYSHDLTTSGSPSLSFDAISGPTSVDTTASARANGGESIAITYLSPDAHNKTKGTVRSTKSLASSRNRDSIS
ncbi:hypothetical protein GLOTRDRAFT_140238 [Gloeophyllum trabeum ATCC 11539]|uniref:Uncharacterized protein n=1 Tax=Gloeophyllum trabeum (strain ATCC 11539 / FP-39264 / Madison 617) TaxID=670483 RepID=S7RE97_GLOTA|nr:uncharacterized protein GLOTRDRAFT_140238 [Gloeophyllum trabeum ATCC 11539]EPQ52515.1 hypothetical protein GLOTRDRAFT_140238 [Gloeophyllum trabeum ATCC 11539]